MTTEREALDEARSALARADQFITNGIALGYIRMPDADTPDSAHQTPGIVRAALSKLDAALSAQPATLAPPPTYTHEQVKKMLRDISDDAATFGLEVVDGLGRVGLRERHDAAAQAAQPVAPRVTEEMVTAYLTANDAYWKGVDELAPKLGTWRAGTPKEATRISLQAALRASAKPSPSQNAASSQEAAAGEPEKFEAWGARQNTGLGDAHRFTAWNAWQARASAAPAQQAVPVARKASHDALVSSCSLSSSVAEAGTKEDPPSVYDSSAMLALLRRIEPHLDAIICYASTMGEHEPNRIAHDVRAAIKDAEP